MADISQVFGLLHSHMMVALFCVSAVQEPVYILHCCSLTTRHKINNSFASQILHIIEYF
jgi:hypothetical protein